MLGKTFKGMTDDTLRRQTEALLEREVARDGHIVYVRPELVVEIAFDGVQASTQYPAGLALRFARVARYRGDKLAHDADTIEAVRGDLRSRSSGGTPHALSASHSQWLPRRRSRLRRKKKSSGKQKAASKKKYGKKAGSKVKRAMHKMHEGTLEVRPLGQEGEEPQAGHRHRAVRGTEGGRQGAEVRRSRPSRSTSLRARDGAGTFRARMADSSNLQVAGSIRPGPTGSSRSGS